MVSGSFLPGNHLSFQIHISLGRVKLVSCHISPTNQFNEHHRHIDVLFPLVGWLIEGLETSPLATGNDDRWYAEAAPLFLPKGHCWLADELSMVSSWWLWRSAMICRWFWMNQSLVLSLRFWQILIIRICQNTEITNHHIHHFHHQDHCFKWWFFLTCFWVMNFACHTPFSIDRDAVADGGFTGGRPCEPRSSVCGMVNREDFLKSVFAIESTLPGFGLEDGSEILQFVWPGFD